MGWPRRLRLPVAASVLLVLLAVPSGPAARARQLLLTVAITGKGTVRLGGRQISCAASCKRTILVRAGSKVTLAAQPGTGWKFGSWAGACRGTAYTCKLRVNRAARVGVTFLPPGARTNPFPLGQMVKISGDWQMKVISATVNATDQVVALTDSYGYHLNRPPPPGAQYTLVYISATYVGGGSSFAGDVLESIRAEGVHNASYSANPTNGCTPPAPFDYPQYIFSGQTVSGNVCFEIASNDADSLLLAADGPPGNALPSETIWFALR